MAVSLPWCLCIGGAISDCREQRHAPLLSGLGVNCKTPEEVKELRKQERSQQPDSGFCGASQGPALSEGLMQLPILVTLPLST